MNLMVHYVDFHWDNYQGGSGKSFKLQARIYISKEITAGNILPQILAHLKERVKTERPFQQDNEFSIQRIEILN